ncbi:MAG TPA: cell division protein ZapA [Candidatus Blautia stercoravium]|nr:cell division protein ZapA [Candidatus Blautia stercoravium]
MAVKNTTQVLIGGKIITLSGYESEEYLQKVANYMNSKMTELGQIPGYNRQAQETRHTLLSLNIADDYFKAKRQAEMFEEELEAKDREMYDLKHDLINGQVELERSQKETQESTLQIRSLEAKIAELEQELDELLKE